MKSVPPRGSGWVVSIANCRFPIANLSVPLPANRHLAIGNLDPTRYREVVLTSCRFSLAQSSRSLRQLASSALRDAPA
jgi:hypothetical protein